MELGEDTDVFMMSEGRKVGWENLEKIEEDRVVEVVPMMTGGERRRRMQEESKDAQESAASDFETDETDGESSLGEEACMAVLYDFQQSEEGRGANEPDH